MHSLWQLQTGKRFENSNFIHTRSEVIHPTIPPSFRRALMTSFRDIVTCIFVLLFSDTKVKASASWYMNECHKDNLSVSYASRTRGQNKGLFMPQKNLQRRRLNSTPPRSFDRMRPGEKMVSGTVRVLADALEDYILGFCLGCTAGAIFGLPGTILGSSGERVGTKLGARSLVWAKQTGEFMGCFRGCATAVRLIRSPKRDNWNIVYGCASAGAFLGRHRKSLPCIVFVSIYPCFLRSYHFLFANAAIEGPVGMATSALIWGAVIYLLEYKTDFCPISRHRENSLSPFRHSTHRAQFGL